MAIIVRIASSMMTKEESEGDRQRYFDCLQEVEMVLAGSKVRKRRMKRIKQVPAVLSASTEKRFGALCDHSFSHRQH